MVEITSHKEGFAEQSSEDGLHRFKGRQEQGGEGRAKVKCLELRGCAEHTDLSWPSRGTSLHVVWKSTLRGSEHKRPGLFFQGISPFFLIEELGLKR